MDVSYRSISGLKLVYEHKQASETALNTEQLDSSVGPYTGLGERVVDHLFGKQREFVRSKAKRKSGKCGRRSGKTEMVAAYLIQVCLNYAGALCGYIAPTRGHAKKLIWRKLKILNKHYDLGIIFREVDLEARFPNGSMIMIAGADKEDQIEKFRGLAFLLFVVDECASFKAHIEELIEEVIEPTVEDYDGTVVLIGTPGRVLTGMFYKVTHSKAWEQFNWTILDNPMFPRWRGKKDWKKRAKKWLEDLKTSKGWEDGEPILLREWLAHWVKDGSTLVYLYDKEKNTAQELPEGHEWEKILSLDFGHDDATAWVEEAYSRTHPCVYVTYAFKKVGLDVTDIATRTSKIESERGPYRNKVADTGALGKMIVATLNNRYHLGIKPAEKKHKKDFQAMMNADLRKALIKILPEAKPVIDEYDELQKDEDGNEDDRFDNHCADAALYGYRECRHYRYQPPAKVVEIGSPTYYKQITDEIEQELFDEVRRSETDYF